MNNSGAQLELPIEPGVFEDLGFTYHELYNYEKGLGQTFTSSHPMKSAKEDGHDCEVWNSEGHLKWEGNWKNSVKHGRWRYYYENGNLHISATFKNGWLNGLFLQKGEDGQKLQRKNFKDGRLHGICELYYKSGQLMYKANYKYGKPHGICENYYGNGQLKQTIKGIPHYINNQLSSTCVFKNADWNGPFKSYFPNGQISEEGAFINGKRDGLVKSYNASGELEWYQEWVNGKCVKEKKGPAYIDNDDLF